MNSYFNSLLISKSLTKHDGRPLWKYNLSEDDYQELKKHISRLTIFNIDSRDITLYYAEWWKNEYDGGFPSKVQVYESLNSCYLSFNDFYKHAKRGAALMSIRWIRRENTHYFRTLLMQGGLPLTHLLKNSGTYTNFLKKVLEINPSSINEFAFEDDIISILPFSSRNEAIYESCLQIVQAIWSGNEEYLAIFENKRSTTTTFKKISDELRRHKEEIEKKVKKRSKFKAHWVLNKQITENKIRLEFNLPDIIEKNDFLDLLQIDELHLKAEYQLVVNDLLICKIKRNIKGNYKIFRFENSKFFWDGEETKPEIFLLSTDGIKYEFPILSRDSPTKTEPTLWTQRNEYEWILNRGKNCKHEKAAILFGSDWKFNENNNYEKLVLNEEDMNWCEFEGTILLMKEGESFEFRTNITSFNWFLKDHKPRWVLRSNLPIVKTFPQIVVYDSKHERINQIKLYWRLYGDVVWKNWGSNLPIGCIEYKINAIGTEEKDYFYNIGNLDLDFNSHSPNEATINFQNGKELNFIIRQSEFFSVAYSNYQIQISLSNTQKMPKSIRGIITKQNQNRSLHIEIAPPFHGVKLFDPSGNIVPNNSDLLIGNFVGYRIIASLQDHNYYIKIYNTIKPHIKLRRMLISPITPLREYEELCTRLFQLTDPLDKYSSVAFEIFNYKGELLTKYIVKNYNNTVFTQFENDLIEIHLNDEGNDIDLFAVPVDCSADNIELISLNKESNAFVFPENKYKFLEKFIIFSGLENRINSLVLPCFIATNQDNVPTTTVNKRNRIINHQGELVEKIALENSWEAVRKYFDLCLSNQVPFSTFDILRAATSTPELISRLFCFLSVYNNYDQFPNFIDKICKDLEDDLGFCFHWISKKHWTKAIEWVEESFKSVYRSEEIDLLIAKILENIDLLISNYEPLEWFSKIAAFTVNSNLHGIDGFSFNSEVIKLRQSLGEKVLKELPIVCPQINEEFKNILPVNKGNEIVKILLRVPIAVALSITGQDESIWKDGEDGETIRRNIQYSHWIAPDWYGKAIVYSLSRLNHY